MERKTSTTHPLRVDFIENLPSPGRLGLTLAPGKKGPSYYGGYWDRDLETDLRVLRDDIGVDVLVTLMERDEMAAAQIPDLLQKAEARGFRVIHFPIQDTRAPMAGQEEHFDTLLDLLIANLEGGATLAVHCRGGLGRSGLVGACLLVRLGVSGDEAMSRVRAARPGAIETAIQERYVMAYAERAPYGREGAS